MRKSIFYSIIMMLTFGLSFLSCSDDVETADIVGTWHATVSGGKANISLTFNSDKTGNLHYCWDNVNYHVVEYAFTYKISGNEIKTSGKAFDSSSGESDCSMTFTYANGKLTGGRWGTDNGYTRK